MNVEIAQRLAELRRDKGYSQEELAENLGLSRQAVSKWERAESSPDTGNLIALARLYGVTLDELLRVDADIEDDVKFEATDRADSAESKAQAAAEKANVAAVQAQAAAAQAQVASSQAQSAYYTSVPAQAATQQAPAAPQTMPVQQQAPTTHQNTQQMPPQAQANYGQQHVPPTPYPNAAPPMQAAPVAPPAPEKEKKKAGPWTTFPYPVLCVIIFLFAGFFMGAWHPAWVIFLTIPLYYWIAHIIENDPNYRK